MTRTPTIVPMRWSDVAGMFIMAGLAMHVSPVVAQDSPAPKPPDLPEVSGHTDALARAAARFRNEVIAQTVLIRVIPPQGRERASRVDVLTDPREGSRRLAMRLGRSLHIEATDDQFRAVSPRNDRDAFASAIGSPLTVPLLESLMPRVPVPHIEWAFGSEAHEGEFLVHPIGWFRPHSVERDDNHAEIIIRGSTADGGASIVLALDTFALRRIAGPLPRAAPGTRVELTCRDADPTSRSWVLDITERRRVDSLSALRPLPSELQPGDPIGGVGLMTPDLEPWLLNEAIREQAAQPTEQGSGPMFAVLVLYRTSVAGAEDGAFLACGSMAALKRNLDGRRLKGEESTPRLLVRPVAVLEPAEFTPGGAKDLERRWASTGFQPVWTSAGQRFLDRFERGAHAIAVVIDEDQRLLGTAAIDSAPGAGDAILAEVRAIIEETAAAPR
jgi:hypothetical protein